MRLLLATLALSSVVHAGEIKCPDRFPVKYVALPANPSYGGASVRITEARLSNAYFIEGQIYGPRVFIPDTTKVKGGYDLKFGLLPNQPRWLVCKYGGERWGGGPIERWERMPDTINSCAMKVREIKIPHTTSDWTATATCK
jgi:hypothetical protein